MTGVTLGIDVACRAAHRASLADEEGGFLWSGWKFRTDRSDLEELWAKVPDGAAVTVVMEPTRNAWVPLAGWLQGRGARVVVVPPEQSADLRAYYNKHTKTDRLDSRVLARLPMLHSDDDLDEIVSLGPADPLKRAVRHRSRLQDRRTAEMMRLDSLVELLGPAWADVLGSGDYTKTALAVLERWADPRALKRAGRKRIAERMIKTSRGAWREDKADRLLAAADETIALWETGGLDFARLAEDIASVVRLIHTLDQEIAETSQRIGVLYPQADPTGIVRSAPGLGTTLAAAILGLSGDFDRFANLGGVRSFTGLVPRIDQSGHTDSHGPPTKSGDPGLRQALYLAADHARKVDPTLAARYHQLVVDKGKHPNSALCTLGAMLITRIASCWRNRQHYQLRDVDGRLITEDEGRAICADRYTIPPEIRTARRRTNKTKHHKQRTGRRNKKSTKAAPTTDPSTPQHTDENIA